MKTEKLNNYPHKRVLRRWLLRRLNGGSRPGKAVRVPPLRAGRRGRLPVWLHPQVEATKKPDVGYMALRGSHSGGLYESVVGHLAAEGLNVDRVTTSERRRRWLERLQCGRFLLLRVHALETRLLGAEQSLYQAALLGRHRQAAKQPVSRRRRRRCCRQRTTAALQYRLPSPKTRWLNGTAENPRAEFTVASILCATRGYLTA